MTSYAEPVVLAELSSLLAAGGQAAFHGVPAEGIAPLARAEALALESGDVASRSRAAWLLGVCRMACGQYGQSLWGLTTVAGDVAVPDEHRALPATAVAAIQRQLGRHAEGLEWDRGALEAASGNPAVLCEALLGLGADSIGLRDADGATEALEQAERLVAGQEAWWRPGIRLGWLRAELALLAADPDAARAESAAALVAAEQANAPRHVAKSLVLAGVAATAQGDQRAAIDLLTRSAILAEQLATPPLVWPSRGLLSALLAGTDAAASQRCLVAARAAIGQIASDLPAVLAGPWQARREIRELLV